ncbi:acyltransferase family protein [Propionicimonas sp.]|uniref:acyltransferase family protein n=1 Tax=Propionicimonas sp. TaxID=1955623 RepID=UPI00181B66F8|nr:acyltransferase family protein [Propionicimonas sp.]MBU3977246.1 acyltransferase [Actinomycetota bacterium]MBA3021172.1 acyltransferase [Propionicimonas sp.]MBU3985756.1 acyltransferase [Actinomycetota bacterium]MBU4008541.1 acyltransferase [Actinomycetota bacterium]MBU4066309.1 acyltransferase [Actinomycetota bacterium]
MQQRNHLVDLARVASMLIVIIFHTLLWQVLMVNGQIQVVPWAPGPIWWAISWICTIIPIFFVAAGYANAVVVDKWRESGWRYARFLTIRGSRLLGPMTLYVVVFAIIGSVAAWFGLPAQASALSRQFAQLLWFAVVYLLLLAAAPFTVWLHDRFGGWVMLPLLIALIAVDVAVRLTGNLELQWLNLAFVWPLAHQWGIAYHRGWFRGWRTATVVGVFALAALLIAALVGWLHYPQAAVAWADVPVANLLPPTLVITLLGLCQTAVLALLEKRRVADRLSRRVARVVQLANALLLSVYLWHVPAIVVSVGIVAGLAVLFPSAAAVLLNPLLLIALVLLMVVLGVPQLARIEVRLMPTPGPGEPSQLGAIGGFALFAAGTWAIWQSGALLHPSDPSAGLALALFLAGAVVLWRATERTSS